MAVGIPAVKKGENFGLELLEPETVDGQSGQEYAAAVVNVCFWLIRRAEARPCAELWRVESACDFDAGENGQ